MTSIAPRHEVVVIGAGLSGLTAAYQLRDRDVLVLEANDRVGGRTLSGAHRGYWYNAGAQYVWDPRTLALCDELGLEVISANGALTAVYLRDRLAVASSPNRLMLKLPLSLAEKTDFARAILRLRRLAARRPGLDPALDAQSLAAVFGRVSPATRAILDVVTESGTGIPAEEVSGAIGLGYAIHLFGGDVNETLKAVRGGTQRIAQATAQAVGSERVLLTTIVESVENKGDRVAVSYRHGGSVKQVESTICIVAVTADIAHGIVRGLPADKSAALERMLPYAKIVSVAWLTGETAPMPWDRLLAVPTPGLSYELFSHNTFFARSGCDSGQRRGGAFVTLSTAARAEALWGLTDDRIRERVGEDLNQMFPRVAHVIRAADTRIHRWHGLPAFRTGWLGYQAALRAPHGRVYFCGDYTSQPGTPGAVNSGYHVARSVRAVLDEQVRGHELAEQAGRRR